MQRYTIVHHTYYNYPDAVQLGPHSLLLRPREDHELRIESFALHLMPEAVSLFWHRDVEGNSVALARFDTPTKQLVIESAVVIQQYNEAPLDFMVADYALMYPFAYRPEDSIVLFPYMTQLKGDAGDLIKAWITDFWQPGEPIQTYTLLQRAAARIYATFTYQVREEPGVQTAEQTLSRGTGSCRDFALLFMEAARCLGLAARFVSGYLNAPLMADTIGSTHAWAEVYLPGAGWKGFDPTIGKVAGPDHIVVAVARLPESVPPVAGSFVGASTSTMSVGVWVRPC
jgi:transglutaminase-like putative cysteine protease